MTNVDEPYGILLVFTLQSLICSHVYETLINGKFDIIFLIAVLHDVKLCFFAKC